MQQCSPKPYLLRALYEWCNDQGHTPYIVVRVDARTRVPRAFVRNDEIVLNISFDATDQLKIDNDWIEFKARFSGKSHKLEIPVSHVLAIYARENGQGMSFPVETHAPDDTEGATEHLDAASKRPSDDGSSNPAQTTEKSRGAHLKLIK